MKFVDRKFVDGVTYNLDYVSYYKLRRVSDRLEMWRNRSEFPTYGEGPNRIGTTFCRRCGELNVPLWDVDKMNHRWCLACRQLFALVTWLDLAAPQADTRDIELLGQMPFSEIKRLDELEAMRGRQGI